MNLRRTLKSLKLDSRRAVHSLLTHRETDRSHTCPTGGEYVGGVAQGRTYVAAHSIIITTMTTAHGNTVNDDGDDDRISRGGGGGVVCHNKY